MTRVQIQFPEPAIFSYEIPIRITDLNYGNHLAHDRLVSILHEVRARFLQSHDLTESDCGGAGIILVDLAVRYRAEAFFGQVLNVEVSVGDVGTRSLDLHYRARDRDSDTVVAVARTGIVFFDYAVRKMVPVPETVLKIIGG